MRSTFQTYLTKTYFCNYRIIIQLSRKATQINAVNISLRTDKWIIPRKFIIGLRIKVAMTYSDAYNRFTGFSYCQERKTMVMFLSSEYWFQNWCYDIYFSVRQLIPASYAKDKGKDSNEKE